MRSLGLLKGRCPGDKLRGGATWRNPETKGVEGALYFQVENTHAPIAASGVNCAANHTFYLSYPKSSKWSKLTVKSY